MLAIILCVSSVETPVLAASGNFAFQEFQSNKLKVGDKKYFFDWSYSSSSSIVRFLCENKSGDISVVRKIPTKEFGFPYYGVSSVYISCRYGNNLYIHCAEDAEGDAFFCISIKDGKLKKIQDGMYACHIYKNRYIVLRTETGGDYFPYDLMVYDAKTKKKKWIHKRPTGHDFEKGRYVYYSKVPSRYYICGTTCHATIYRYDILSGKTTTLAKSVLLSDIIEINSDYMAYKIEPNTFKVKEFSNGKKAAPKDGKYYVQISPDIYMFGNDRDEKKPYSYCAKIKNNTLTLYGSYKTKGKNDVKRRNMYKFTLASSYKIGCYEAGEIEYIDVSQFNKLYENLEYGNEIVFTVKNKKVTNITLYP